MSVYLESVIAYYIICTYLLTISDMDIISILFLSTLYVFF